MQSFRILFASKMHTNQNLTIFLHTSPMHPRKMLGPQKLTHRGGPTDTDFLFDYFLQFIVEPGNSVVTTMPYSLPSVYRKVLVSWIGARYTRYPWMSLMFCLFGIPLVPLEAYVVCTILSTIVSWIRLFV